MGLKRLNGHTDIVTSVAFSSDGTHIVSGSNDKSVRVWDASTGMELKRLNGHTDNVTSVTFSSDSTRIISGSDDGSVRVWDLQYHGLHWMTTPQHWIVSLPHHHCLMWVPSEICDVLQYPSNTLMISCAGSVTINFVHSKIDTAWAECYTPQ
jgi:WD40 repeat protein